MISRKNDILYLLSSRVELKLPNGGNRLGRGHSRYAGVLNPNFAISDLCCLLHAVGSCLCVLDHSLTSRVVTPAPTLDLKLAACLRIKERSARIL